MTNFNVICGSPVAGASLLNGDLIVLNNPDDPTTNKCTQIAQLAEKIKLIANAPVNITATLAVTHALHSNRPLVIKAAAGCAITLPLATGTGDIYEFYVGTTITSNTVTIAATGTDKVAGNAQLTGAAGAISGFSANGTSNTTVTMNGTTKGGILGDIIQLTDIQTGLWALEMVAQATGTLATPIT